MTSFDIKLKNTHIYIYMNMYKHKLCIILLLLYFITWCIVLLVTLRTLDLRQCSLTQSTHTQGYWMGTHPTGGEGHDSRSTILYNTCTVLCSFVCSISYNLEDCQGPKEIQQLKCLTMQSVSYTTYLCVTKEGMGHWQTMTVFINVKWWSLILIIIMINNN